jgi:hypothetical protein
MYLIEIGWGGMDWIDLALDRDQWRALVNTVMNLRIPQNVGMFLNSCTTVGFSKRVQLQGVSQYGVTDQMSAIIILRTEGVSLVLTMKMCKIV